jgi:hypothetical protein
MTTVGHYLDGPEPSENGISAASYFLAMLGPAGLSDPVSQAVRVRGDEAAAVGPAALAGDARAAFARLPSRLAGAGSRRRLRVAAGLVMTLDEYLRTRVAELVVHVDDLAASLGAEPAPLQPGTSRVAIDALVDVARLRYGDLAVRRALARRERDQAEALRVL